MSRAQCMLSMWSDIHAACRPHGASLWASPGLALGPGVSHWLHCELSTGSHCPLCGGRLAEQAVPG